MRCLQQNIEQRATVVLIGGGHANCQVLIDLHQSLPKSLRSAVDLILINDGSEAYYSGMLPGAICEYYSPDQITIYLKPLAHYSRANFIDSKVCQIKDRKVFLQNGEVIPYNFLSINIGSTNKEVPGVQEFALSTRPLKVFFKKILEMQQSLLEKNQNPDVVIVGGGAAGVELCFTLRERLLKTFDSVSVKLLQTGDQILAGSNHNLRNLVLQELQARNIEVIDHARALEVTENSVVLEDGRVVSGNFIVWATGAKSIQIDSDLAKCEQGYFLVNECLQSVSDPAVFAAGDCITIENMQKGFPPKAGVYAVREGPLVSNNLKKSIQEFFTQKSQKLQVYQPQTDFLTLFNLGDGRAIASKWGKATQGRCMMWLKDRIDRKFVKKFHPTTLFSKKELQKYTEGY